MNAQGLLMFKTSLFFFFSLLLISCASHKSVEVGANQKAFEEEDKYILYALNAEELKENSAASSLFQTLYEKSGKKEYLYRSLENDLVAKKQEKLLQRINSLPPEY